MKTAFCFAFFLMAVALFSCKNMPPSRSSTALSLTFEGIKTVTPNHLYLSFILKIENRLPLDGKAEAKSWYVDIKGINPSVPHSLDHARASTGAVSLRSSINGQKTNPGISLASPSSAGNAGPPEFTLNASSAGFFPLTLALDMATLAAEGIDPADDYRVNLIIDLALSFDDAPPVQAKVSCIAAFPGVRAPEFTVTAIAILRDELINTKFRVTVNINNPNSFPVTLSSINYELYGNGLLWADGAEKTVLQIPGKSSAETSLVLVMNFINMKRDLLDRIIRLQNVNYRFTGNARVATGVDYLPVFNTVFDLAGHSPVLDE